MPAGGSATDGSKQQVFALVQRACDAYDRSDLTQTVAGIHQRLEQPHVRVVVLGEFKKGKSTLVNALVGSEVCPADDDVPTAVPTILHHAEVEVAALVRRSSDGRLLREPLTSDAVTTVVTATSRPEGPVAVEIGLPRRLLSLGLQIMDTPGVGGLVSAHGAASVAAAATADAVLFVTDALQELTAPELENLRAVADRVGLLAVALTKTDIAPSWRQLLAIDEAHLADAGVQAKLFPVAAPLRRRALDAGDQELNTESGYDRLIAWLTALARSRETLAIRVARAELERIVSLLEQPLETERSVLGDPERQAAVVAELRRAQERAERLRSTSQGWQQLLADRVADLTSEIDHELRRRIRVVNREMETLLDDADPADIWMEFEPWLRQRVAADVGQVVADLQSRASEVTGEVFQRFSEDQQITDGTVPVDEQVLGNPLSTLAKLEPTTVDGERPGIIATGLTALRGVQGGVLMFGMVGNMVGLAIAGPALIGIGLVMGGRSLVEERRRQLGARRQQARQAVRGYLDEVSFHVGKDVRDALRLLQRGLRDYLGERAATVQRTVAGSLEAAERSVQQERSAIDERRADLDAELERLARLRAEIEVAFRTERGS